VGFVNPYGIHTEQWDYGLMFRNSARNVFETVVLESSTRKWYHHTRNETFPLGRGVTDGAATGIDQRPDAVNSLRLIALQARGWLFLNGEFVGSISLAGARAAGDVAAIAGLFPATQPEGSATAFRSFKVWAIENPG